MESSDFESVLVEFGGSVLQYMYNYLSIVYVQHCSNICVYYKA